MLSAFGLCLVTIIDNWCYQNNYFSRQEGESQTESFFGTADASATLQRRCHLCDKLSVLFEPRHARHIRHH